MDSSRFSSVLLAPVIACRAWNATPRSIVVFVLLVLSVQGVPAQSLSLPEAFGLAGANQPLLEAQRAAIESSQQAAIAAGQLPDPKLKVGVLNMPVNGADAFTFGQDFMTMRMIGVMQEFPREEKRRLRGELVRLDGEQKSLELDFMGRMIRRDAGLAWLDVWFAERAQEAARALQKETETQIESLAIDLRAGRAGAAEVAAARVELELSRDREAEYSRRAAVARAELGRWIGEAALRPLPADAPALPETPSVAQLLDHVERHPHLSAVAKQAQIAETDARLAQQAAKPDWNVELAYAQRGSAYSNMVSIQFGIDLPLFQSSRQDRVALSRIADASRARSQRDDNLRQMRADLLRLAAERDSAAARAAGFRDRILPQARARVDAATASYRAGKGSLSAVLEARRALLDLQLERLDRESQAARGTLQLDYFTAVGGGQ
jgi:cobalt-zinc-cadmium efflux system outer membrane protein